MKKLSLLLLGISALALQGCIDRDQADKKIAEACSAGVAALLDEGYSVEKTMMSGFEPSNLGGPGSRQVKLTLSINDGFASDNKDYSCIFFEQFGPFNMTYTASIYQLMMDGNLIGQDGLRAEGSPEQIKKLNDAVAGVLNK